MKTKNFTKNICFLVRSCLLITLIKCLKGHKSPGSLSDGRIYIGRYELSQPQAGQLKT